MSDKGKQPNDLCGMCFGTGTWVEGEQCACTKPTSDWIERAAREGAEKIDMPQEFWEFANDFANGFGAPNSKWNIGGFLGSLREAWNRGGPMPHADECNCGYCPNKKGEK